jgi:hypothetical protein
MHNCIKQYNYQSDKLPGLERFDTSLYELQSWRRRSLFSQQKVRAITGVFQSSTSDSSSQTVLADYKHILAGLQEADTRLENMLPAVTSLVQIADTRQYESIHLGQAEAEDEAEGGATKSRNCQREAKDISIVTREEGIEGEWKMDYELCTPQVPRVDRVSNPSYNVWLWLYVSGRSTTTESTKP